jgi:hypothetical protein
MVFGDVLGILRLYMLGLFCVCVCRAVWQCDFYFDGHNLQFFTIFPLEKKKKSTWNGAKKKKKKRKKETGERETKNVLNIQLPAFRCNF